MTVLLISWDAVWRRFATRELSVPFPPPRDQQRPPGLPDESIRFQDLAVPRTSPRDHHRSIVLSNEIVHLLLLRFLLRVLFSDGSATRNRTIVSLAVAGVK